VRNRQSGALSAVDAEAGSFTGNEIAIMLKPNANDPSHWRHRAAQMRSLARTMAEPTIAILMRDLAADYDKLADCAALKANSLPNDDCRSWRF
jgi:hypothetical protein